MVDGEGIFWCMENKGGRGRDIIRKYTFESGARPAAGTASLVNNGVEFFSLSRFTV